jgi:hypothetical protein
MFHRLWLILFIIFITEEALQAQNGYTQNFSMHSPNAFAFSKIDNIPMNNFTGMANINLPLYEKKMSVLNFSIGLNYSGSGGIKAQETASIVGKGWLLHLGGMIVRHTRGVPDDYQTNQPDNGPGSPIVARYNGLLYNNGVTYKPDGNIRISINDPVFNYAGGYGDSQHDVFEFNIPGKSGKFYIGKDKQIVIVTDSKVKIIPDFTNSTLPEFKLGSFLILDEAGIKYYFNQIEVTTASTREPSNASRYYNKEYASSWLLTKIEAPFGEETITYQYVQRDAFVGGGGTSIYYKRSDQPSASVSGSGGGGAKEVDIQSITFSDQSKINFKYFLDDTDDPGRAPLLESIEILNTQQEEIKTYYFNYKTWGSDKKAYYTNAKRRLRVNGFDFKGNDYLNNVDLVGSNNNNHQAIYAFDYFLDQNLNESSLPDPLRGYDYWGYYNGKTNADVFVIPTQWGPAADRSPDLIYAKLGSIKKIIYPTGGSEEFEYELNDKRGTSSNVTVAGLRIKKRTLHDGINTQNDIIKEYRYVEVDGLSSGFLGEQPEFTFIQNTYSDDGGWPSNPHLKYTATTSYSDPANPLSSIDGSFAGYRRVEELFQSGSNGKIVYEFSDLSYAPLWAPRDYYPYRPVDRPYWAIGLPLKTTYFSSANVITKQIVNEYNIFQQQKVDDNYRSLYIAPNGEVDVFLPSGSPDPNALRYIYKFSNYYPIIGRTELKATHEYDYPSIAGATIPKHLLTENTYDANYFVPRTSSQLNADGSTLKKYLYYAFDYNLGASSFTTKLTDNNIVNQPILTESWISKSSGNNYLIQSNVTDYQILSNGVIRPFKAYTARLAQPLPGTPGTFSSTVLLPPDHNFKPVLTFNIHDDKSRMVEFENQGGVKSAIILDKSGNTLAKADNASFNTIAYSGFETDDSGNWTYASGGVSSSSSKSGSKSYSGSISKSALLSGNYNVALWAKGSGAVTVNAVSKPVNGSWALYTWTLNGITSVSINTNGNLVDQVVLSPQSAQIATTNYNKGNDIESITDLKGNNNYFEYDEFNRLINIKNQNGSIVKNYAYQYKPPFLSISQSGSFTRSTCDVGYVPGPPVTYTIPPGKYTSIISQEDADAQAWSDVYGYKGQENADVIGECNKLYYNADYYKWFTRDNCPPHTFPSELKYPVPAKTFSSIISQDDADLQARNYADANGQNYVNANTVCAEEVTVTFSNTTSSDTFGINFSSSTGYNKSYVCPKGSSSLVLPAGVYNVSISVINTNTTHNLYVGSRTAVVGTFTNFTNVNISNGSGAENKVGMY